MRTMYYMFMTAIQDYTKIDVTHNGKLTTIGDQVQKYGIIDILLQYEDYSNIDSTKTMDFNTMTQCRKLKNSLPYKTTATHICTTDFKARLVMKVMRPFMTLHTASRFQIHTGYAPIEISYKLLSYGIPVHAFPFDRTQCNANNANHLLWLQRRKQLEEAQEGQYRHQQQREDLDKTITSSMGSCNNISQSTSTLTSTITAASEASTEAPYTTFDDSALTHTVPKSSTLSPPSSSPSSSATTPTPYMNESDRTIILNPGINAVILGRGHYNDHHIGNVRFRHYLHQPNLLQIYKDAPTFRKRDTARQILCTIMKVMHPITFLKEIKQPHSEHDGNNVGNPTTNTTTANSNRRSYQLVDNDDAAVLEKIQRTLRRGIQQLQQHQKKRKQLQMMG